MRGAKRRGRPARSKDDVIESPILGVVDNGSGDVDAGCHDTIEIRQTGSPSDCGGIGQNVAQVGIDRCDDSVVPELRL